MGMVTWRPTREEWDDCYRALSNGCSAIFKHKGTEEAFDRAYGNALLRLVQHPDPNPMLAYTMGKRAAVDVIRGESGRTGKKAELRGRRVGLEVAEHWDDHSHLEEDMDLDRFEWVEDEHIRHLCVEYVRPVIQGQSKQDVAAAHGVSPARVSQHLRKVREYLGRGQFTS